jgi:hypothetical protein
MGPLSPSSSLQIRREDEDRQLAYRRQLLAESPYVLLQFGGFPFFAVLFFPPPWGSNSLSFLSFFLSLQLPKYQTEEVMREKLLTAITMCRSMDLA